MKTSRRSIQWLLLGLVVGAVAVPSAVAAWPRSLSCSSGSRFVHLGEKGQAEASWDVCAPEGFRVATFQVAHHCMTATGAWISNFGIAHPDRKRPLGAFPRDGIAVRFGLDPSISSAGDDSALPLAFADLRSVSTGKTSGAVTRLETTLIQAEHLYHLKIWMGRDVRPADQRVIEALVSSLRFVAGKAVERGFVTVSSSLP